MSFKESQTNIKYKSSTIIFNIDDKKCFFSTKSAY